MIPNSPPILDSCKTWNSYYCTYLQWMKQVNHPDLKNSNYRAQKFLENHQLPHQKAKS